MTDEMKKFEDTLLEAFTVVVKRGADNDQLILGLCKQIIEQVVALRKGMEQQDEITNLLNSKVEILNDMVISLSEQFKTLVEGKKRILH